MGNRFRAAIERLESRDVMTGISAVLGRDGVLAIETHGSTTLTLQTTLTRLNLLETEQTFALKKIKSIEATLDGNVKVIRDNRFDGVAQGVEILMTFYSQGGSDSFLGLTSRTVYFGGSDENTLTVDPRSHIKIDGRAPDWFDYHVPCNAVGVLARELAVDKTLSFNDMDELFRLAAEHDHVGKANFNALRAIVEHDAFFANLNYVQELSRYVMFPCKENAEYQQHDLGNLKAASSGRHLEKLADKWFAGLDHPEIYDTRHHQGPICYRRANGSLFDGPPNDSQIHQGASNDCYFLSSLEAVALKDPDFVEEMFVTNVIDGEKVYTVRFFDPLGKAVFVTVDSRLPVVVDTGFFAFDDEELQYNNRSNVLWSAIAEKAYVQLTQFGWSRPDTTANSYQSINTGRPYLALQQITGKPAEFRALKETSLARILAAFDNGQPVVLGSRALGSHLIVASKHDYALIGYTLDPTDGIELTLFNPWGQTDHVQKEFVTLPWKQVMQYYHQWSTGAAL